MRSKGVLYIILTISLLILVGVLVVYSSGVFSLRLPSEVIKPPSLIQKCGLENCHGLELTCGPNIAEVCTEMYTLGDRCRQFAKCEVINGECQLVKNPRLDECRSCVQDCLNRFPNIPNDFEEQFTCESRCGES